MSIEEVLSLATQVEEEMAEREFAVDSDRVLKLAAATSCSAYDCEFVGLAQHLGISLVTNDKHVLKAFPDTAVSLEEFTKPPANRRQLKLLVRRQAPLRRHLLVGRALGIPHQMHRTYRAVALLADNDLGHPLETAAVGGFEAVDLGAVDEHHDVSVLFDAIMYDNVISDKIMQPGHC